MARTLLGILFLAAAANAADLTIVAISAFGENLHGCSVAKFHRTGVDVPVPEDYTHRFHGLVARDIPLGEYKISISCDGAEFQHGFTVQEERQFELVVKSDRMIMHCVGPSLTVKLRGAQQPEELWWISMRGRYNGRTYTGRFVAATGEAKILNPEPGSYTVSVESTSGYSCEHRVDFMEFTRLWEIDPAECSMRLDRYAHVVKPGSGANIYSDPWYDQMRAERAAFYRMLLGEVEKTPQ